ncbi:hypothetical protein [Cystobacter fuscus]|uniref:hypothetical protein n=1 Tax=Cystobacter fuscus TaxID=43 RepID=UPI002B31DA60|nr:hypothetical protein F0U63_02000 [Cystobacter fuscus]
MRSLMTFPLSRILLVGLVVLFALDGIHLVVTLLGKADDNALDVALHLGTVGLALGLLGAALALAWKSDGVFGFSWALSLGLLLGPALYAAALWAEKHPEHVPGRWMLAPFVGSVGYVLGGIAALAWPWPYLASAVLAAACLVRSPRRAGAVQALVLVGALAVCVWGQGVADFIAD